MPCVFRKYGVMLNPHLDTRALDHYFPSEDGFAHFYEPCVNIFYVVEPSLIVDGTSVRPSRFIQRHRRHRSRGHSTSTAGRAYFQMSPAI